MDFLKNLWQKVDFYLRKFSPLQIVYKKDSAGKELRDEKGELIPDTYTAPWFIRHILGLIVLGVIVYVIYIGSKIVLNFKTKKA